MKRRFQFRLRTLFVAMTAVALLCPYGVRRLKQWKFERELDDLIETVNNTGGGIQPMTAAESRRFRESLHDAKPADDPPQGRRSN